MFGFLKKKIQDFTGKIKEAIEKKEQAPAAKDPAEKPEEQKTRQERTVSEVPARPEKEEQAVQEPEKIEAEQEEPQEEAFKPEMQEPKEPKAVEESTEKAEKRHEEIPKSEKDLTLGQEDKRKLEARKSIKTSILGVFSKEIKIEEADVREFLEEFELALLESDVEQETANAIVENIRKELVGKKASKKQDLSEFLKQEIKESLSKVMQAESIDFWKKASEKKPFKIMFLGPNGAGKTTSISKLAFAFKQKGMKVVFASSDTFRAGSIEQIEKHAERLGIRVVRHNYGADPAAVAFDAVKAAEAEKADAVLIDTAGRQETNKNLMQELKKIARVIQPDLKIYVGESFTGQALLQQASEFDKEIGIDGFILTKIDTDAKGGTAISLIHKLKKPIVFVGTGQAYEDLMEFKPEFIIDRIV